MTFPLRVLSRRVTKFLLFSPRHYTINAKEAAQAGTARMLNSYIDDKTAIGALTEDFENYLRLCRLLMRIYNTASTAAFRALFLDFLRAPGDCIVLRSGLSRDAATFDSGTNRQQ